MQDRKLGYFDAQGVYISLTPSPLFAGRRDDFENYSVFSLVNIEKLLRTHSRPRSRKRNRERESWKGRAIVLETPAQRSTLPRESTSRTNGTLRKGRKAVRRSQQLRQFPNAVGNSRRHRGRDAKR